jgi:hypothetical protein
MRKDSTHSIELLHLDEKGSTILRTCPKCLRVINTSKGPLIKTEPATLGYNRVLATAAHPRTKSHLRIEGNPQIETSRPRYFAAGG